LANALHAVIDQRPALRARTEAALREARAKLTNLIQAVENGSGTTSIVEAIRTRETEIRRLQDELSGLEEPLEHNLAVMPTWVRRQLEDIGALLSESPERCKNEFRRLGLALTFRPVDSEDGQPYLRVEGTTEVAALLSGQCLSCSTTDATDLRRVDRRSLRFVVDLPQNHFGPGWFRKPGTR
jgi:hypothetical protein